MFKRKPSKIPAIDTLIGARTRIHGDVATDRVELGSKARVQGNVRYSVIESAVGAQINGKLIHRTSDESALTDPGDG